MMGSSMRVSVPVSLVAGLVAGLSGLLLLHLHQLVIANLKASSSGSSLPERPNFFPSKSLGSIKAPFIGNQIGR